MHTRLYDDSTFSHRGHEFHVTFPADDDNEAPWEHSDGHGPVSGWTKLDTYCDDNGHCYPKVPAGKRILARDCNRYRLYDFAAAVTLAIKDGWGVASGKYADETPGAYAARAVEADFVFLRGWCNDEWHYCGVVVKHVESGEVASLWGIEDNAGDYLTEVAYDLADEILSRIEVDEPQVQLSEN